MADKVQTLCIRLQADQKKQIEEAARERGVTMTEFVVTASALYSCLDPQVEELARQSSLTLPAYISLACEVFFNVKKALGKTVSTIFS